MSWRAAIIVVTITLLGGVGCATKSDVDSLRADLAELRNTQDSLARDLDALRQTLATELEAQGTVVRETRGVLERRIDEVARQLVQIQELLGQSQVVLRRLREGIDRRGGEPEEAGPDTATAGLPPGEGERGAGEGPAGAARSLYTAAIDQFRRGNFTTARTGFEEFLVDHSDHELAPRAQYHLAETYREAGDPERAVREYNRVVQLYPNSESAPESLYKAGLVQVERGNKESGCQYFERVLAGYPRSDEARLARDKTEELNCR